MCADFLTTHFEDLPAYNLPTVTARCGEIDLPTLERQAKNFLHIYGKDVDFEHSGNICKDLLALTNMLKENLPEIEGIELVAAETDDGEKHQEFIAYESVNEEDFRPLTLFFLPVKIVDEVDEQLRDILIDFFTFLDRNSPFLPPKASFDMRYILGISEDDDDQLNEEVVEDWSDEYKKLAERYVNGDINAVFEEMDVRRRNVVDSRFIQHLNEKIEQYKKSGKAYYFTPNGEQKTVEGLFKVISEGISLGLEDNIFNYELRSLRFGLGDETFYEYVETDEMLDFDRQFMFCWGLAEEDDVVDRCIDMFNSDAGNFNETVLLKTARIAKCEKEVKFGDYPKRWYQWFIDLLNYLYE
ncbi:MAG: hypothetical protein IKP36_05460 [Bacteroidaceae bacterium]|nr:hypothetical protein [Bacteroidaceae bacterium]